MGQRLFVVTEKEWESECTPDMVYLRNQVLSASRLFVAALDEIKEPAPETIGLDKYGCLDSPVSSFNFEKHVRDFYDDPTCVSFLSDVFERARIPLRTIVLGILYLHRMETIRTMLVGTRMRTQKCVLVGVLLACKYLYDDTYSNTTWATIASNKISLAEVNKCEFAMLFSMDFNLMVTTEQWKVFLDFMDGFLQDWRSQEMKIMMPKKVPKSCQSCAGLLRNAKINEAFVNPAFAPVSPFFVFSGLRNKNILINTKDILVTLQMQRDAFLREIESKAYMFQRNPELLKQQYREMLVQHVNIKAVTNNEAKRKFLRFIHPLLPLVDQVNLLNKIMQFPENVALLELATVSPKFRALSCFDHYYGLQDGENEVVETEELIKGLSISSQFHTPPSLKCFREKQIPQRLFDKSRHVLSPTAFKKMTPPEKENQEQRNQKNFGHLLQQGSTDAKSRLEQTRKDDCFMLNSGDPFIIDTCA